MEYFNVKSEADLFYKVGAGEIDATQIKKFQEAIPVPTAKKGRPQSAKDFQIQVKEEKGVADDILLIGEDEDRFDYSYASCCNPIPGDSVMGYITISKGIKIHRTDCPNVVNLVAKYGDRVIKVAWANTKGEEFEVHINIEGTDRVGLTRDVTKAISTQLKVNMTSVHFETNHSVFTGNLGLSVKDKEEVDNIVKVLKSVDGVIKVSRIETDISI
jgi:GTP pyrophosphokinase